MLNNIEQNKETIVFGDDSIVIVKYIAGIPGGRTLDLSDYTESVVRCGHVIYRDSEGAYRPMPVTAGTDGAKGTYSALPEGGEYAGVLYRSISKNDPEAAVMVAGVVNSEALPYALPSDFSLTNIITVKDEEA
jgi:hypothetical protein